MRLVVSLRIPDGVVIATDSLSTVQASVARQPEISIPCPKCKEKIELQDLPPMHMPMPTSLSTSSFAQKLFPFFRRFGIGAYGVSILSHKTIGHHLQTLARSVDGSSLAGVTAAAEVVLERFDALLKEDLKGADLPDETFPLGFHVDGYDEGVGKTLQINIGKNSRLVPHDKPGCTVGGSTEVARAMWDLGKANPRLQTPYQNLSLQDAIDYAEFLIRTTSSVQRFGLMIPNVGGAIDVALVTPFDGFQWIKRKKLATISVGGGDESHEHGR